MARYLLKRLAMMLLTLLIVITLTFFLMKLIPGSPLGNVMKLNHAQQVAVEKQYGLNQPVWRQYLTYLVGAVHGNFGMSYQYTGTSVASLIMRRVGPSIIISLQALVVGTAAGIVLGSLGALHKGRWQDSLTATLAVIGISFPSFILAILLQYYLGFKLQLFPVADWQGLMSTVLPTGPHGASITLCTDGNGGSLGVRLYFTGPGQRAVHAASSLAACLKKQYYSGLDLDWPLGSQLDYRFDGGGKYFFRPRDWGTLY